MPSTPEAWQLKCREGVARPSLKESKWKSGAVLEDEQKDDPMVEKQPGALANEDMSPVREARTASVGDMVRAFEAQEKKAPAMEERPTILVKPPSTPRMRTAAAPPVAANPEQPKERPQPQRRSFQASKDQAEGRNEIVPLRTPRPDSGPGYCITSPICRIEVQEGWVRVGLLFRDPCDIFAKIQATVFEDSVSEPAKGKIPSTRLQYLRKGADWAARSGAVQATAAGALGGAAACGAAGAVGGAAAGGSMGAMVGLLAAPLTLGLSIPVGAALGSSTGLCMGGAAGLTAGSVGGGAFGFLGYKISGIPGAVLGRMGARRPTTLGIWRAGREEEEGNSLAASK